MMVAHTDILALLKQRTSDQWLVGCDSREFYQQVLAIYQQLNSLQASLDSPPQIIIAHRQPIQFLAAFLAAVAAQLPVFLANPNWSKQEWQQVLAQIQPNLVLGKPALIPRKKDDYLRPLPKQPQPDAYPHNLIGIPTGGSSGKIRFAVHTWSTLTASVWGFWQFHQQQAINSVCVLPLHHVSGLMQFLRSLLTGGKILIKSYHTVKHQGFCAAINPQTYFISLVPTQLQSLIDRSDWLVEFKSILVGGASPWPNLLTLARKKSLPLALTYGMTETASGVATLPNDAFLAGKSSNGMVLPHAQIWLRQMSSSISAQNPGLVKVQAQSLFLGYYGQSPSNQPWFETDDLGYWQDEELYICGRNSRKIISGGENIFPAEVEAAMLATNLVADVCVIGIKDRHWGEAVAAIYVPYHHRISPQMIKQSLHSLLSRYKQPKYWIATTSIPRNAQGKSSYEQLLQLVTQAMQKAEV